MHTLPKMLHMHDKDRPDHECLFLVATGQMGYFTAAQAAGCGFQRYLLSKHVRTGRFVRVRHGLYRLRDYPPSQHEHTMAGWLAVGPDAVVSHESALELLGLGTVIPRSTHITLPRSRRYVRQPEGVTIHTTTHPLSEDEKTQREGIQITSPARTIADVAATYLAPDQVEMAAVQALVLGLAVASELQDQARRHSHEVQRLITDAIELWKRT